MQTSRRIAQPEEKKLEEKNKNAKSVLNAID
jgi:hypothetical protein